MDIVDSHHHVWRTKDMPWLSGPMMPRIFGPYEPIKRDYLIDEYIADARSGGITQSVYVQANWPLDQVLAEVRWLNELHEETGWPTAVVGSADLFSPDAVDVMAEQATLPIVRGTRLQLHWHERAEFRFASAPDTMRDPVFRRNVAALEEFDWVFELQVFPGQLADAAALVAAVPDVTFVLVHAGMLTSRDEAEVRAWRTGMARLAALPNVVVKLTGQGTFLRRLDREFVAFVARETLGWFGPDRAMFGTNFPVEKLWTELPPLVAAWRDAVADLPAGDRAAIFAGTARRVYGLSDR
jgi:predicted TIM-barrel fold metal-dependent hydrolase